MGGTLCTPPRRPSLATLHALDACAGPTASCTRPGPTAYAGAPCQNQSVPRVGGWGTEKWSRASSTKNWEVKRADGVIDNHALREKCPFIAETGAGNRRQEKPLMPRRTERGVTENSSANERNTRQRVQGF